MRIEAKGLTDGIATGILALLSEPLSLWGGLDLASGRISDATHPQCGRALAGKIVAMRAARGSSSSSSALVEAVRAGTAPAAIILAVTDPILVIGSLVAADLYGREVPILLVPADRWHELSDEQQISVQSREGAASVRLPDRA